MTTRITNGMAQLRRSCSELIKRCLQQLHLDKIMKQLLHLCSNSKANALNSIAKVTNSIAKVKKLSASATNSTVKVPNATVNGTKSTAKVTN